VPANRAIAFLTDFGLQNEWVGVCHAVMNRFAPGSPIVDLSHFIPPLGVSAGARLLTDSLPYVAGDAILLAVVDPTVGKDRDIAVEATDGRLLVGPDNGLLSWAFSAAGGVRRAVEITSPEVIVTPVSPSFHARDVLCPAAAHLARGNAFDELGPAIDPETLSILAASEPEVELRTIRCEVIDHNRFGNIQLNVRQPDLARAQLDDAPKLSVEGLNGWVRARRAETYADFEPGEYGVIFDPRGWLMVVRGNPGNALEDLRLSIGDMVWITAPEEGGSAARTD
jgi:S-adenosyl-L-methionine hydrolase (adenosine-forming)